MTRSRLKAVGMVLIAMMGMAGSASATDFGALKTLETRRALLAEAPQSIIRHIRYQWAARPVLERGALIGEYLQRLASIGRTPENLFLIAQLTMDQARKAAIFETLTAEHRDFAWGHYGKGYMASREGRDDVARSALEKARTLAPGQPEIVRELAAAVNKAGNRAEALALLDRALAGHPAAADLMVDKAYLLTAADRLDEAVALARKAMDIEPFHQGALWILASVPYHRKQYIEAEAVLWSYLQYWASHAQALGQPLRSTHPHR